MTGDNIQFCNFCNTTFYGAQGHLCKNVNYRQQVIPEKDYYNPKDFVTREHFDKTIEELKKMITGLRPVGK